MKILNTLAILSFFLLALTLLIISINVGMERSIEMECQELYKQSTQYENFFYSENQAVMCNIK